MYSSISNQLINGGRFLLAYYFLFFLIPQFLFSKDNREKLDNTVSNYVKMVFFLIVLGYILVFLKLFEFLALFFSMLIYLFYRTIRKASLNEHVSTFQIKMYDLIDHGIQASEIISKVFAKGGDPSLKKTGNSIAYNLLVGLIFAVVFAYAAYLRFYDAVSTAAPAMSDAYVTLTWMKYINQRIIFHDGLYPQGFHIILAIIQKIAAIDPLYVLKYTGPLNGLLITASIGFFVYRFSGRIISGLLASFIYGVLGGAFFQDWIRQASTNSQEFAFIFVFPALYFFGSYIIYKKDQDLIPAAAAVCVAGLTHSLGFAYIGWGMGLLGLAALIGSRKEYLRRILYVAGAGILSVIVSLLPVGLGLLLGRDFHESSTEYLGMQLLDITLPQLTIFDYMAIISIGLLLLALPLKRDRNRIVEFFIVIFGATTFALFYFGGTVTHSAFIYSRADDLWTLALPVCIGFGWNAVGYILPFIKKRTIEVLLALVLVAYGVFIIKPLPIIPYKMEYNSNIEQYLRISKEYKPTTWLVVSQEEGYAIVLGKSWHLMMQDFLKWYDPSEEELVRKDLNPPEVLRTEDIFIYEEKELFTTSFVEMAEIYARRKVEKTELADWLRIYRSTHDNISLYFEDDNIRVWHIHQETDKEKEFRQIWEEGGNT